MAGLSCSRKERGELGVIRISCLKLGTAELNSAGAALCHFTEALCVCSRQSPGMLMVPPATRGSGNEHLLSAISPCYYFGPLTMNEVQAELSTNHLELHVKGSDELALEPVASRSLSEPSLQYLPLNASAAPPASLLLHSLGKAGLPPFAQTLPVLIAFLCGTSQASRAAAENEEL